MEADLIEHTSIEYSAIPAAGLHGVGWKVLPRNILRNLKGITASLRILKKFQPQLVFLTGGYLAAPMVVAARLYHIPALLFSPDIEPGQAVRLASRMVACTALPAVEARRYFPSWVRTEITGYPVRSEISRWNRQDALTMFDLDSTLPTLLFLGGSKGARSINRAVKAIIPQLLESYQVLHITGALDWQEIQEVKKRLQASLENRYHIFAYLHEEMGAALACADLVISRAGASILGEYPTYGLPAILVPYPHAWRYQTINATHLVDKRAAVILPDGDLQTMLLPLIRDLTSDPGRLKAMSRTMRQLLPEPPAAERLAQLARQIARNGDKKMPIPKKNQKSL